MNAPATNHTIAYLGRRFSEAGVRLNHRHGQNFLIDQNLLKLIVSSAALGPDDVVLEVGTGTGALTALMAPLAAAVVTAEIDEQLYQLSGEELFGHQNIVRVFGDALRSKSQLAPRLIEAVQTQLAAGESRRLKLVANLPYSVATPVIANLLASPIVPHSMTVTIQKEVADRLAAKPGSKDYGAMSVWVQSQCRVHMVRTLPPGVFWPRPKVTSAIVQIDVDPALRGQIADLDFFHDLVRKLFLHRRKFLRAELVSALKDQLDKPGVDALLTEAGLSPDDRAEQLTVADFVRLAEFARRAIPA
jgi:16S rRNA (adenine1518-N6/adenine1519-N6)-dimethyltransferase